MDNPEELYESGEARYLRLGADGKIYYITAAEARKEKVLARPRGELSDLDIIVFEWNDRCKMAEQLKERISEVHQAMRDDAIRPSQYEAEYNVLWHQYRAAIESLRELDAEAVGQFRSRVAVRVKELETNLTAMHDAWNPDGFEDFEQTLIRYEKNYDLMMALSRGRSEES